MRLIAHFLSLPKFALPFLCMQCGIDLLYLCSRRRFVRLPEGKLRILLIWTSENMTCRIAFWTSRMGNACLHMEWPGTAKCNYFTTYISSIVSRILGNDIPSSLNRSRAYDLPRIIGNIIPSSPNRSRVNDLPRILGNKIPSSPNRSRVNDLPITSWCAVLCCAIG